MDRVAVISGLASLAGYGILKTPRRSVAFVDTFAAEAILAMLADTMMPEGYQHRRQTGWHRDDPGISSSRIRIAVTTRSIETMVM